MMFFALLACFSVCFAGHVDDREWQEWKLEYGKVYSAEEEEGRYTTWLENKVDIELHNADYEATYTQGLTEWSDMTQEEFEAAYLTGYQPREKEDNATFHVESSEVPNDVDWRNQGLVTGVKNQGRCGSCYSFSATGALEGQWMKARGQLNSLSEKQIVDCSGRYGNMGCRGGRYQSAWSYLRDAGGSQSEQSYPYQPRQGWCQFDRSQVIAQVSSYQNVGRGSESSLTSALGSVGPVSVAIDASRPGFRNYRGGVFYDPWCSSSRMNHAVLAVGYGSEGGSEYYLVKNSWGGQFGVGGYIKMARNRGNNCGIASDAAYPIV